jgi:hypothetical protein
MELIHLAALDNRINHEITPLNSTAIYPKLNHALYCVLTSKTKSLFLYFCLDRHRVLFFSLFFSKLEHLNTVFFGNLHHLSVI